MQYTVGQTVILVSHRDPHRNPVVEATITRVGRKYAYASVLGRPFILDETHAEEGGKWSSSGYGYSHTVYSSWEEYRTAQAQHSFRDALRDHSKFPKLSIEEMVDLAARLGMRWAPPGTITGGAPEG